MVKRKTLRILAALMLAVMLPTLAAAETKWIETPNGKGANMRSGPSEEFDRITVVPYACAVDVVYDILGSSYAHCFYNGVEGYIYADYLADYEPEVIEPGSYQTPWPVAPTVSPTRRPSGGGQAKETYGTFEAKLYMASVTPSKSGSFVNMRWAPSDSAEICAQYYNGAALLVIAENGTWSQVLDLDAMRCGFMMSRFLQYSGEYGGQSGGGAEG